VYFTYTELWGSQNDRSLTPLTGCFSDLEVSEFSAVDYVLLSRCCSFYEGICLFSGSLILQQLSLYGNERLQWLVQCLFQLSLGGIPPKKNISQKAMQLSKMPPPQIKVNKIATRLR